MITRSETSQIDPLAPAPHVIPTRQQELSNEEATLSDRKRFWTLYPLHSHLHLGWRFDRDCSPGSCWLPARV